jgi:hypothetical protein
MKTLFPSVRAVMARRILVNYRVRPEVLETLVPPPFRPKLIRRWGMAGVCLIRLEDMRPPWLPRACGVASENAAHRIAVEWTENGRPREGVFIPRRDTNSLLNRIAGGRLFPGVHHSAKFRCSENGGRLEVELRSSDSETRVHVVACLTEKWIKGSVFESLDEASEFFRAGSRGWSPSTNCALEGVELCANDWVMHPLSVEKVESSFFNDGRTFPAGAVEFDSALLMRGVSHQWRALGKFAVPIRRNAEHRRPIPFIELP